MSSIHISLVTPPATNGPRPADARVHLEEVKVFAQLNGDGPSNDTLWYLDMGVTNQMIGLRAVFSELVGGVVGTMRFGDGSVFNNQGCGIWSYSSARPVRVITGGSPGSTSSCRWTPISSASGRWMRMATTFASLTGDGDPRQGTSLAGVRATFRQPPLHAKASHRVPGLLCGVAS